jgi:hypothetical protein
MELLRASSSGIARPDRASAAAQLAAGTYVTDERRLFRVVRALAASSERASQQLLLELEDCGTLELVLFPSAALSRAGLRRVVPTLGA